MDGKNDDGAAHDSGSETGADGMDGKNDDGAAHEYYAGSPCAENEYHAEPPCAENDVVSRFVEQNPLLEPHFIPSAGTGDISSMTCLICLDALTAESGSVFPASCVAEGGQMEARPSCYIHLECLDRNVRLDAHIHLTS